MNKTISNLSSRIAILTSLLIISPFAVAQVVSPIAPIWKWGIFGSSDPNTTHVYDSYEQIVYAYIRMENTGAANQGYTVKWTPRVNVVFPPGSYYREYCHNCNIYTTQRNFSAGALAYEKHHLPHPLVGRMDYEYTVPSVRSFSYAPTCPAGYGRLANTSLPYPERFRCERQQATPLPEKAPKSCPVEGLIGNPINLSLNAKYHSETDYQSGKASKLKFKRQYISGGLSRRTPLIGKNWWHNYDRHISLAANSSTQTAYSDRSDGRTLLFTLQNGLWKSDSDINDSLVRLVDAQGVFVGWEYFDARSNEIEEYNTSGKLIKIKSKDGQFQVLTYSDNNTPISIAPVAGLLIQVSDQFGRSIQFSYNAGFLIKTMIDPDGNAYKYEYTDKHNYLESVTYPDNFIRIYHYENTTSTPCNHALTGITDERGIRYATYTYDSQCRITSSEHAGGINHYGVTYGTNTATVQDPLNTSRTYNFTTVLGVTKNTSVSQPCATCGGSSAQARTYDTNGNVSQKTDFNGNITKYQYNTRNLEISRTEAFGTALARTITTIWHSTLTLPTQIDEPGKTTVFSYDSSGKLLARTETDTATSTSRSTSYTYNSNGQVLTINGPRTDVSDITEFEYDADGNISLITDALGHETEMPEYDAHGNPLTVIDPNGVVTELEYDARQRLISRTVAAGTSQAAATLFDYDPVGNIEKITQPDGSYLEYIYDNAQRLIKIEDNLGNYISYTLDNAGNRTAENVYDPADVLVKTQGAVFNSLNRLIESVGANSQSTDYAYDNNGNQTSITDSNNNTTTNTFDGLNRLIKTVDPQNGATNPTEFGYDARGNLTQVEDPRGLATQYQYNGFNEVTQVTSPDTGITTYSYDLAGNRISKTDANLVTINYSYDALNRLTLVNAPGTVDDISYSYDTCSLGETRLCSITRDSISVSYTYDAYGNIANVEQAIGAVNVDMNYIHNEDMRLESVTYPGGVEIQYGYDSAGRISSLTLNDGLNTTTLINTITYQSFGPIKSYAQGNGIGVSFDFDLDGRIESLAANTALNRDYTYDPAGNIGLIDDAITNTLDRTYSYDAINRLSLEENLAGTTTLFDYAYDAVGNRILYDDTVTSESLTYGTTHNRLTAIDAQSITSDNNGNITLMHDMTLAYDVYNRLGSATVDSAATSYAYNGLGERVTKQTGSNTRHYFYGAEQKLLAEYDSTGVVEREYIYLNGQPVVMLDHSGSGIDIYWIHNDHLGRPLVLTDEAGAVVWRLTNADAFGNAASIDEDPDNNSTNLVFNLRFPGQYFDNETGLHYNYFRDYDPKTGRYIESDPIGLFGGINTYAYVNNNPIHNIDPAGLGPWSFGACTVANAAYQIYSSNKTISQFYDETDLLRDQLNRVNKEIGECPSDDLKRLSELNKIRNDLVDAINESVTGTATSSDNLGLGNVGSTLVIEGACGLLFYAPIP